MTLEKKSGCKVNLLLNILGKRADGFHELETLMHPVNLFDSLTFERGVSAVKLTCSDPALPVDEGNLVHRAAQKFFDATGIADGVAIHLEKRIPLAAGLGGGSGNAATTLLALNELFDRPLQDAQLGELAAALGSDVPFFLQGKPAIATERGERIEPLDYFPAFGGAAFLLIHPGFGVSTAWAYQNLSRFPDALNGRAGRASNLARLLNTFELATAAAEFYNSLEEPVLEKYPLLRLYGEFLRENGALVAMMSGSGSTVFGIYSRPEQAAKTRELLRSRFGPCWAEIAEAGGQSGRDH